VLGGGKVACRLSCTFGWKVKLEPLLEGAAGTALDETLGLRAAAAAYDAAAVAAAAAGGLLLQDGLLLSESVLKLLLLGPAAAAASFAAYACWSAA
jgi:hypothetical protein